MKQYLFVASLGLLLCLGTASTAQLPVNPFQSSETLNKEQLTLLEESATKLSTSLEQLRKLADDGLVATNEVAEAEENLAKLNSKIEDYRNRIASEKQLALEQKKADELTQAAKTKSFVKPVLKSINMSGATVMRSTTGNWSLANLGQIQQFFSQSFGRQLPVSTIGQSATHNRLRWNHRNSVDVGVHPDSPEGLALMAYLQQSGIPFLAFRAAVPGVSTGPHIHIGFPSQRMG